MKTAKEIVREILDTELVVIAEAKRENIAALIVDKLHLERVQFCDLEKDLKNVNFFSSYLSGCIDVNDFEKEKLYEIDEFLQCIKESIKKTNIIKCVVKERKTLLYNIVKS